MWKITEGNKILNVKSGAEVKNYYAGDTLPEDYKPHKTYIEQGLVIEVKKTKKGGLD
jgi:hypothetical protein